MTINDLRLDATKLIKAFMNNGLPEEDAWDAARAYRNCISILLPEMSIREIMMEDINLLQEKINETSQNDYNAGVYEEICCWEN